MPVTPEETEGIVMGGVDGNASAALSDCVIWKFPISQDLMRFGRAKMREIVQDLGLDKKIPNRVGTGFLPVKRIIGRDRTNATSNAGSTDRSTDKTIKRYDIIWRQIVQFCIVIGDYESAIIFDQSRYDYHGMCQNIATAASRDTLLHFLRFKIQKKGIPLRHISYGTPIVDYQNRPMACSGDWQGESSVGIATSAIAKVHSHYENLGSVYLEFCQDCRNTRQSGSSTGCAAHSGLPRFLSLGCPTSTTMFTNAIDGLLQSMKEDYPNAKRATVAILPSNLRKIRNYCIHKGEGRDGKFFLMIWTIIIVGVKQMLRINEVLGKTIENFEPTMTNVCDNNVVALVDSVLGKTDQEKVYLMLWDDEQCPEFSPTRAIMLWLKVSGIKSGFLFPTRQALATGDISPQDHLSYDAFLYELKCLYHNVLSLSTHETSIVGTHTLRKTGYLMAVWGTFIRNRDTEKGKSKEIGAIESMAILLSARHSKSSNSANFYIQDCVSMWHLMMSKKNQRERNRVSPFLEINIARNAENFHQLNEESKPFQLPIVDQAHHYIDNIVRIANPQSKTISEMAELVRKFVPLEPVFDNHLDDELMRFLKSLVPNERHAQLEDQLHTHIQELQSRWLDHRMNLEFPKPPTATFHSEVTTTSEGEQNPTPKKKRKMVPEGKRVKFSKEYQAMAAEYRNRKSSKCKAELLSICQVAVYEVIAQKRQGKVLDDPEKSWANKAAKGVACLRSCCNKDVTIFLESTHDYTVARFKCHKQKNHNKAIEELMSTTD